MNLSQNIIEMIEPGIYPLVHALNKTNLLRTVSSCQGHYDDVDQERYFDRTFADVRFEAIPEASEVELELVLRKLISEYIKMDSPVEIEVYKKYMPFQFIGSTHLYVLTLTPIDRFDVPVNKRKDTDNGNPTTKYI